MEGLHQDDQPLSPFSRSGLQYNGPKQSTTIEWIACTHSMSPLACLSVLYVRPHGKKCRCRLPHPWSSSLANSKSSLPPVGSESSSVHELFTATTPAQSESFSRFGSSSSDKKQQLVNGNHHTDDLVHCDSPCLFDPVLLPHWNPSVLSTVHTTFDFATPSHSDRFEPTCSAILPWNPFVLN